MVAADAPYEHLPMELRLQYCTNRDEIVPTSQWYHRLNFAAAGSPPAAHLRYYTKIARCRPHGRLRRPVWPPSKGATATILHPHLAPIIKFNNTLLDFSDLGYFLVGSSLSLIVILTWNTLCNNGPPVKRRGDYLRWKSHELSQLTTIMIFSLGFAVPWPSAN